MYYCVVFVLCVMKGSFSQFSIDIPEDTTMTFLELSQKYLQKGEEHDLVTDDGYILKLFRIPGDQNKPLLLVHGAIDSSDSFIMRGNISIAVALSRANYDIWAINFRGNDYSRRHVSLNPDLDKKYWDFSLHEFGYKDLPPVIDFIVNKTNQEALSIIGHSEGTATGYVLGATRPEYNDKIKIFISMAPIAYMHNVRPYMSQAMDLASILFPVLRGFGLEEVIGYNSTLRKIYKSFCLTKTGYVNCLLNVLFLITGPDADEIEPEFFPIAVGHFPAGTSIKNLIHLLQIRSRKKFANYDYGYARNFLVYNRITPPEYDLSKVTMKVALLAGKNDRISTIKDVELLREQLPNVVDYFVFENDAFNHVDYVLGKSSYKTVYPRILEILDTYQ